MARKAYNLKNVLIAWLRRLSYRSPMRGEAMRNAKVSYGRYKCKACQNTFSPSEINVDHVEPVIATTGFTTWDDYINRLFCPADQMQILCKPCHSVKSATENKARKRGPRGKKTDT